MLEKLFPACMLTITGKRGAFNGTLPICGCGIFSTSHPKLGRLFILYKMNAAETQRLPTSPSPASLLLTSLYWVMWPLVHACCWCFVHADCESARASGFLYLWAGLIFGQIGGSQMWRYRPGWGGLLAGVIAVAGVFLATRVLNTIFFDSDRYGWLALFFLVLGCKAAWWALVRPENHRAKRARRTGSFTMAHCMAATFWVAIFLLTLQLGHLELGVTLTLVAIFGGMSLFLAVHRFAFQQLFWPDASYWPGPDASRIKQACDAAGILGLLAVFNGVLAWGLWQFYGSEPEAWFALCLCWSATIWQALDLQFERIVYQSVKV